MAQWLQPVFASLDAKTLQQLNASIAVEGLDAKKVAADYLKQKGGRSNFRDLFPY